MFGFGNSNFRRSNRGSGTFGGTNLRRAALAGVGMLAYRWWRNRQADRQTGSPSGPTQRQRNPNLEPRPSM
jgi:uncharacterized membrane protein YebE (DUF533 family)